MFDTTDFGYQRITVERPLRLRYRVGDGTLDEIQAAKAWAKLTDDERAAVTRALDPVHGLDTTDRDVAAKHLTEHGPVPKPIDKAVWTAISVRDPDAPVVKNKKGEPEPDPELRDYENVPLGRDISEYLAAEVLPHVAGAWIDEGKTKVGYEIPFTCHFYRYTPLRPLAEARRRSSGRCRPAIQFASHSPGNIIWPGVAS